MNTPKRYRLLKDLPDAKEGTILEWSRDYGAYMYPDKYGKEESLMFENVVKGNPDWFQELPTTAEYEKKQIEEIRKIFERQIKDANDWYAKELLKEGLSVPPQPEPVKDFEILTVRNDNVGIVLFSGFYKNTTEEILESFSIHSVKRLSDGEVFKVNDITNKGKINAIKISYGHLWFDCGEGINAGAWGINDLKIATPQPKASPLFTTEDGVPVYMYQWFWVVELPSYNLAQIAKLDSIQHEGSKYFSTKEAAEAYIKANKPQDIKDNVIELLKEDLECVHHYLDDLSVPRRDDNGETYSIAGRIKQLEINYIKKLSEIESEYLSKPQPQDSFTWTIQDICNVYDMWVLEKRQSFRSALTEYAQSKSSPQPKEEPQKYQYVDSDLRVHESDTPISATVKVNTAEQPKKERTEVVVTSLSHAVVSNIIGFHYYIWANQSIPKEKFHVIKQAIEQVLNDDRQ